MVFVLLATPYAAHFNSHAGRYYLPYLLYRGNRFDELLNPGFGL